MKPGKLDRRIRIEYRQVTQDPEYGTETILWAELATVSANIEDVLPSRSENQSEGIRISERPARVRIRYLPGIDSSMRVVWIDRGDRVMKIVSGPAELGRREGIELMCAEFSTAGETT
jgi:head-tail adaptor